MSDERTLAELHDTIDKRLKFLEDKFFHIRTDIGDIKKDIGSLSADSRKLSTLLMGNGDLKKGLSYRFFQIEAAFLNIKKAVWIAIGIVIAGSLGLLSKIVVDFIQSGPA